MHEEVGARDEVQHPVVVVAPALRSPAGRGRLVVGDVGDRRRSVGHPVAERPAPGVGDLARGDLEAVELDGGLLQRSERPGALQAVGRDREERRAHHAGQHLTGGAVLLGEVEADIGIRAVEAAAERQALQVVPVQVREEERAPEGGVAQADEAASAGRCRRRAGGWVPARRGRSPRRRCGRRSGRTPARGPGSSLARRGRSRSCPYSLVPRRVVSGRVHDRHPTHGAPRQAVRAPDRACARSPADRCDQVPPTDASRHRTDTQP